MKLAAPIAMFLGLALCGRAEILLKGIMISDGAPAFSLYSVEDQETKWVSLGRSFAGFKVVDFDPQTEVLTVVKDEIRKELRMEQSRIKVSIADSIAPLNAAQGIDFAYELLKQKDQLLVGLKADARPVLAFSAFEQSLKQYQSISVRVQELSVAQTLGGAENDKASSAMDFLKRQQEALRGQVEKSAIDLRTALEKQMREAPTGQR